MSLLAKNNILEGLFNILRIAVGARDTLKSQHTEKEIEGVITSVFGADPQIAVNVYNRIEEIKKGGRMAETKPDANVVNGVALVESSLNAKSFLDMGIKKKTRERDVVVDVPNPTKTPDDNIDELKSKFEVNETADDDVDLDAGLSDDEIAEANKLRSILEATDDELIVRYNGYVGIKEFAKEMGVELGEDRNVGMKTFRKAVTKRILKIVDKKDDKSNDNAATGNGGGESNIGSGENQ